MLHCSNNKSFETIQISGIMGLAKIILVHPYIEIFCRHKNNSHSTYEYSKVGKLKCQRVNTLEFLTFMFSNYLLGGKKCKKPIMVLV